MNGKLSSLEPRLMWQHFEMLTQIPHESGNEAGVMAAIKAWAAEHDFPAETDATGNVLVRVPATAGRENATPVMIQGHVDMVCIQDEGRGFDFDNDPIDIVIDDGWVRANGTSLGADNGIGVAAGMAAADDPDVSHGPLELLFTVDEETGLTGASNVDFPGLTSKRMLNVDSEETGILYVGCAGGGQDDIYLPLERQPAHTAPDGNVELTVHLSGLKGGHSGLEISSHHANAIKALARALWMLHKEVAFELTSMEGGTAHNAIPNDAAAVVVVGEGDQARATAVLAAAGDDIKAEFDSVEPGMTWTVLPSQEGGDVMSTASRDALLRLLLALPHGIMEMSADMPGLVESSVNIATLEAIGNEAKLLLSSRSSVSEALAGVRMGVRAAGELAGARVDSQPGYPAWRPNMDSALLALSKQIWQEMTGKEPEVTAIHAGLECGIIGEKIDGLDMISFGPDIEGAHTPKERVKIDDVAIIWEFIKRLLAQD